MTSQNKTCSLGFLWNVYYCTIGTSAKGVPSNKHLLQFTHYLDDALQGTAAARVTSGFGRMFDLNAEGFKVRVIICSLLTGRQINTTDNYFFTLQFSFLFSRLITFMCTFK